MIANYSPCRKKAAVYPGDKVNENFDETFGSKLKPFRGYVRYGGEKQQVIMLFDHLKNESRINDSELELAFTIMSFFVKGCQMKPEQEYRHLILMTNESISSIELNAEKDFSIDFSDISGLVRNEYYEPNDCNDSFVADLYDCSYTITRNQYTDD